MEGWDRLIRALGAPAAARLNLRPPATEAQIAAAEGALGFHLPSDYRALLAVADGQHVEDIEALSVLPGGAAWFASYLDQSNFMLDLIPGPRGTSGQLLELVSECDYLVVGDSLDAYFRRAATLVETGKLVVARDDDGYERLVMPGGGDVRKLVRGGRQRRSR